MNRASSDDPATLRVRAVAESNNGATQCSRRVLEQAFELAPSPSAFITGGSRVSTANRALCALAGYTPAMISGMAVTQLCVWLSGESTAAEHTPAYLVRSDGVKLHVRARLAPLRSDGEPDRTGGFLLTLVQTEVLQELARTQARMALLAERLQLAKAFVDQSRDALVVHGLDRTIRYWSRAAERMFGYTREQATGKTYEQLFGSRASLSKGCFEQLLEQGAWRGEMTCIHAAGHQIVVERHYRLVRLPGGARAIFTLNIELQERQRATTESTLVRNLLEQRLKLQTAQLFESTQEMRDIAYSIAHDLRAPVTAIQGFATQLQKRLARHLDDTTRHYFERLRAGADSLNKMTAGLQTLANISQARVHPRRVDMAALAQRIYYRLRALEPTRDISFSVEAMPPAVVDFAMACMLLEHLVGNSLKFTARAQSARITFSASVAHSGACIYRVHDNGVGFDRQYAFKLFTPFQRLHSSEEFPGIGIGLAIARKIVARHGGRIWAESKPGHGTTVSFTFHDPDVLKSTPLRPPGKIAENADAGIPTEPGLARS